MSISNLCLLTLRVRRLHLLLPAWKIYGSSPRQKTRLRRYKQFPWFHGNKSDVYTSVTLTSRRFSSMDFLTHFKQRFKFQHKQIQQGGRRREAGTTRGRACRPMPFLYHLGPKHSQHLMNHNRILKWKKPQERKKD